MNTTDYKTIFGIYMKIICYGNFIDYQVEFANAFCTNNTVKIIIPSNEFSHDSFDQINKKVDVNFLGKGYSFYDPRNIPILKKFFDEVINFNPDVIHMQLGGSLLDLIIFCFFKKYPLVVTFHDVKLHLGEDKWKYNIIRYWLRGYSDQIIVHGDRLKELMIKEYEVPRDKVNSIIIGEHETKPFKKYEDASLKEERNSILFFGRIYEYKGLDYLIKAEPFISKEIPGLKIIIAGLGDDFEKYEKLMVNKSCFFVHNYRISYKEGAELFQKCSIVVLPYIDASQSGVIPTAYSFKKPVVATDVGSVPEIVDDGVTGFIVPAKDSNSLATAIIKLLKEDELREIMGQNAYKKLKTDMSWEYIKEKTIKVYEKAMFQHNK